MYSLFLQIKNSDDVVVGVPNSQLTGDHLEVVVDAHFAIKPTGVEYHDNRQKVLQAIYRAVKKTGVNFESRIRR